MKDRRAQAWLARGAAPLVSLALAWSALEPASRQVNGAGFDWEQQGPAAPTVKEPTGGSSLNRATLPPLPSVHAVQTRIEPPAAATQRRSGIWPAETPGAIPLGPVQDRLKIERLPSIESEPAAHPDDKFTDAQPWQGEVSVVPLPNVAESPAPQDEMEYLPITPTMAAVLREAEVHTRRGMELGGRRAYYSAQDEFIQALNMIAQALDAEQQTTSHSAALAAGLRAIEESDDFARHTTALAADVHVQEIASLHRTPVVRQSGQPMTPLAALQLYYTYAQQQLAASVDHHAAASAALTSLGKLYSVASSDPTSKLLSPQPKAMALHQAALLVDRRNAAAANELGVLLARFGRYDDAIAWLQHSVVIAPQPATWHNLAVVHKSLGQSQLAESARRRQAALAPAGAARVASNAPEVRWVSASEFAATGSGVEAQASPPAPTAAPGNDRAASVPTPQVHATETMGSRPRMEPPRSMPRVQ
jgi:tetratricopeptide (TPR) repeat protein